MASRAEYTTCMKPHITGKGLSKEERTLRFCVGAKLCSGKAKSEEEAKRICLEPKPPKQTKPSGSHRRKGASCEDHVLSIASCMVEHIDMNQASNINSVETAIVNAMMRCECLSVK